VKLILKKPIVPYAYDPRKEGVTQSVLQNWLLCHELGRLGIVEGLSPKGSSKPLVHGDIMHKVLKKYYTHLMQRKSESLIKPSQWVDESYAEWTSQNKTATTEKKDLALESSILARVIIPRYIQRWHKTDGRVKWTMAETLFRVNVPVTMDKGRVEQVVFTGQMDGGFEDKDGEHLFETKNKGDFNDKMMSALTLDLQLGAYLTALGKMRNSQPSHVLYNLIRRPQERKKVNESVQEFADRIADNMDKDPAHYFERYRVDLTKDEIEKQVFSTEFKIAAFYRWWESHSWNGTLNHLDPMWNGSACVRGYITCHFIPVCANGDRSGHEVRRHAHPELA
jgi:hypothetical protein